MAIKTVDSLMDKEAERAVLGSMMTDKSVIPSVESLLGSNGDGFFTTDHKLIYEAILSVNNRDGNVDPILVANELNRTEQLNRVGGSDYLYELQAPIVETESTEFYAEILREKMTRRKLINTATQIREMAQDESSEINEVVSQSQTAVMDFSSTNPRTHSKKSIDLVKDNVKDIEEMVKAKNEGIDREIGIRTGFHDFDTISSGLQNGNVVVIAARPGMGKTTLALNMAHNIAVEQNKPVVVFSLEMPAKDITMRMLSADSGLEFGRLRKGNFSDDLWDRISKSVGRVGQSPLLINDNRSLTVHGIRAEARRLKFENPELALVVVDYIQIINKSQGHYSREQEIAEISRSLKVMAWELDIPVLACSQLSREVERRPGKQPQLSDLRESGAIEQDADLVSFLYRDDYYEEDVADDITEAHLIIRKHRNGPTGTVMLRFRKPQMRFENFSR